LPPLSATAIVVLPEKLSASPAIRPVLRPVSVAGGGNEVLALCCAL
jgi:hypothetical protein